MTRALVVDDSHFMRTVISDMLEDGGIQVVDQAENGEEAIELVAEHRPDVVTMDVEMPVMDGIEAVENIMRDHPTPILMLSAITTEGADATLEALDKGAIDVFPKPGGSISTKLSGRKDELLAAVERTAKADPKPTGTRAQTSPTAPSVDGAAEFVENPTLLIGASTGGPGVVEHIVTSLPTAADLRVLVIQHMPDQFTGRFAKRLDTASGYDVAEATDGARIGGGEALVARGDYHMSVSGYSNGRLRVKLDQSEPVHSVRPAIDVTMMTAAERISDPMTAVLLTGMGRDGATGIEAVKEAGGRTIAQDEATSAVFGIPARAIETGCVDKVLPVSEIPEAIRDTIRRDTRWMST